MSDLRRIILLKKRTDKQDTGSGSMQKGPSRGMSWQDVAGGCPNQEGKRDGSKDVKG